MDKREFRITADGSHTLYVPHLDETYHSKHGAIQEALHVFIGAGFNYFKKPQLKILEVGFGTGLNAFLTLLESEKIDVITNYTGIEAFPLDNNVVQQLNYTDKLSLKDKEIELFGQLHKVEWESYQQITKNFTLNKLKVELGEFNSIEKFDIVYFDAFGPQVQPEMWTLSIFEAIYNLLSQDGILVTYCAKGSVKRALKEVGFKVESLPGPPGKREMTRAVKL